MTSTATEDLSDGDQSQQQENSLSNNNTGPAGGKKVRKNHNEFEKRRREQQRLKLEELRQAIPGLDAKSSMVAILGAAREFIDELRVRNSGLENIQMVQAYAAQAQPQSKATGFLAPPGQANLSFHGPLARGPSPLQMRTSCISQMLVPDDKLYRKDSSNDDEPVAFKKGREEVCDHLPPVSALADPQSTVFASAFHQTNSEYRGPNQARPSLIQSVIDEAFFTSHRKDSGLLLPTQDPLTFVFGQRDSMHNLFSLPLPNIQEPGHATYVGCGKCFKGIDGLIMIDCDACHRWYHIRCMGIDSSSIPVKWVCQECPPQGAAGSMVE